MTVRTALYLMTKVSVANDFSVVLFYAFGLGVYLYLSLRENLLSSNSTALTHSLYLSSVPPLVKTQ